MRENDERLPTKEVTKKELFACEDGGSASALSLLAVMSVTSSSWNGSRSFVRLGKGRDGGGEGEARARAEAA